MAAGDIDLDIQNYQKPMDLEPDNRGVFYMLKKMRGEEQVLSNTRKVGFPHSGDPAVPRTAEALSRPSRGVIRPQLPQQVFIPLPRGVDE